MATRCVHCGSEMESLFTIFGQPQVPEEEGEDSLPDIIEEIRTDPALQVPAEPEPNPEAQPSDQAEEQTLPGDQLPNWLAKVRERATEEEDAIGGLVSGTIAMDAVRGEEGSAGVEGEFNAWINRIREKSEQENSARVRQLPSESESSDEVPEWLQRIRALSPRPEEEITHEVKTTPAYADDLPKEWTDEALLELRRQALAEAHEQETEPLPDTGSSTEAEELPAEPVEEGTGEPAQQEPRFSETEFHNIPNDEEEYPEPAPVTDLNLQPSQEEEFPADDADEQEPETDDAKEAEKEFIQDISQQESIPKDVLLEEEPAREPEAHEMPEPQEPESLPAEAVSPGEEPEEEPGEEEQPTESAAVPPDLLLLRDQQDRASLLASLIEEEGRVTAGKQAARKPSGREGRLAVALLLIIGLIVSMLIGPASMPTDTPRSLPALALDEQIKTLAEGDRVLVVLDYQAATSRELEALAAPLLEQFHSQDVHLEFFTTQPSGLFLAQSLIAQTDLPEDTKVDYLPGSYLSLISSAVDPTISDGVGNPNPVKDLHTFKLVLLVSDSSDAIRGWLEQIAPWIETLNFAAVTTQMEAPVLIPYFDSGQLVGYAAGIADGNLSLQTAFNYRAFRVGLLLMLVMLLLGMISKGEADAIRREEESSE